jgi:hypothetical protein
VLLEVAGELPALVARVGDDGAQVGEGEAQPADEAAAGDPVGDAGGLDAAGEGQAEGVDKDVALAPLDPLVRVEAARRRAPSSSPTARP